MKKAFYVSLRDAFLIMDPEILKEVEGVLKEKHAYTEQEIANKKIFNFEWFRLRVPRSCPAPTILFSRVKSVYEFYGDMEDATYGPLFNNRAWKKAAGVLQDIANGLVSDPPDVSFNRHRLNSKGVPLTDRDGLHLYRSWRGTTMPEAVHHQLVHRFGSWNLGAEMADCILAEFRHRHNIRASERHRLGFPRIGHFDTWLTDKLQRLYLKNRGIQRHRGWTCACDYGLTSESFGIVPLSTSIHDLPSIALTPKILGGLSRDKAYLADRLGTKLPLLPVVGKAEKALFNRLVVQCGGDFEKMTLAWSDNVNGTTIFPKIAAQLRIHKKKWEKAETVKKLLDQSAAGRATVQMVLTENTITSVPRPTMPLAIAAPNDSPRNSADIPEGLNPVAGLSMETDVPKEAGTRKRKHGDRGRDKKPRGKRSCSLCLRYGNADQAKACKGSGGTKFCPRFLESGTPRRPR